MGSKYGKVIDKLPREMEAEDSSFQEKVTARKNKIRAEAVSEDNPTGLLYASRLAASYADIRRDKEDLKEELSEIEVDLEAHAQLMMDQFENEGITSQKLDDGQSVSVRYEPNAQVVDKEAFRLWCIKEGLEKQLQLHHSTTVSLVKERLLSGDPEPDGIRATARKKVSLTKGR